MPVLPYSPSAWGSTRRTSSISFDSVLARLSNGSRWGSRMADFDATLTEP